MEGGGGWSGGGGGSDGSCLRCDMRRGSRRRRPIHALYRRPVPRLGPFGLNLDWRISTVSDDGWCRFVNLEIHLYREEGL